ncbi:MAG: DEAD/DEAH box helicase [Porphyromonadaceae bacterium]|jgi:SNF2 family DNA or RNA helicase|nr:DEAD/DEAH box helicase [Porphyromonadaceae bacterium]
MSDEKLILTIVSHPKFGNVLQPIFTSIKESSGLFEFVEIARSSLIGFSKLNDIEKQVVRLTEKYSDAVLMRLYSREKKSVDFIRKVQQDTIERYIRPLIEARHREILKLAKTESIPIFVRESVKNRTFHIEKCIQLFSQNSKMVFLFSQLEKFTYKTVIRNGDIIVQIFGKKYLTLCASPAIIVIDNQLHEFSDIDEKKLLPFFTKEHIEVPQKNVSEYIRKFVTKCVKDYDVVAEGFDISEIHYQPKALLYLETSLKGEPVLRLQFLYGNKKFEIDQPYVKVVELDNEVDPPGIKYFFRDEEWELNHIKLLENSGLSQNASSQFCVKEANFENENSFRIIEWINSNQELLKKFELKQNFSKLRYFTGEISLNLDVGRNQDWFDIRGSVRFDEVEIPFANFKNHILNKNREYVLPDGSIAILPIEWFSRYTELFRFGKISQQHIQLRMFHFRILELIEKWDIENEVKIRKSAFEIPETLQATLRPYQKDGFRWLVQLQEQNFGGCLADDMGLGKTLQTIALLLYNYPENRNSIKKLSKKNLYGKSQKNNEIQLSLFDEFEEDISNDINPIKLDFVPPSLIVMPTSLIFNWHNELQKFAPTLKVYIHTGIDRVSNEIFNEWISDYDIVLTTYGIMRQDIEFLALYHFQYVILDESQYIKNPASQTFQCAKQLQSRYKLVLTGTPIENSLTDLWAQMDFLNDGILGTLSGFQRRFKEEDVITVEKTKSTLLKIINPFILKRLKEDVVKELPPLTEEIRYCEMSEEQSSVYFEEKNKARNAILEQFSEIKDSASRNVTTLTALTKLRLIANHPIISIPEYTGSSGKFEQIIEHVEILISEGHKVLIFSSFVKHLRLVADYFDTQNWKYAWLTGSTTNRETEIDRFNQNEEISVFFISLKAGGTGLNLTTADYVFILDPWWNPAAEMQAVSRAHRIGQDKKVTLYRFITKNSVEEKIHQLQQNKSELLQVVVSGTMSVEAMREVLE